MKPLSIASALLSLLSFSLFASSVSASSLSKRSKNVSLSDDDDSSVEEALAKEPLFVFIDDGHVFVVDEIKYKIERASDFIESFEAAKKADSNSKTDVETLVITFNHIIQHVDLNHSIKKYRDQDHGDILLANFNYKELASVLIHGEGRFNEKHFFALYDFMADPSHSFFYSLVDEMNTQLTPLKEAYELANGKEESVSLGVLVGFNVVVIASFSLLAWAIIPIIFRKRGVVSGFEKE